jgi:carbamoyltransferase
MFSIAIGPHDHNTYDGKHHNQIERHSRIKHNFDKTQEFFNDYYKPNNPLCITATIGGIENTGFNHECLSFKPKKLWDYWYKDNLYYIDHHQSHAVYALLTSGFSQSDVLAIDGRGWNYKCVFFDKNGNITDLSDKIQIGLQWNYFSKKLGFGDLGAGKLMGLSAYGEYNIAIHLALENKNYDYLLNVKKEDIAATLQYHTIDLVKQHVFPLKSCDNICIAGGVAYNGYMNEEFTKHYDKVHVPPAPGDEGQSLGTYMHADYILNNNIHVPETYAGKEYKFDEGDPITPRQIGEAIAAGKIVGWFYGKSESGNRALGNRSILADPRNPKIKDIINKTIKQREDFRPFAPSVMEDHYKDYFDTNQPSPYMSRIMPVKSDKIPGVTHVDGTARIQTVNRKQNEKFYDVIHGFYQATGIPMVLNTSFNCKEPIVETPEDAINTFNRTQLDMVVINNRYVAKVT